jgi:hypothetical protein
MAEYESLDPLKHPVLADLVTPPDLRSQLAVVDSRAFQRRLAAMARIVNVMPGKIGYLQRPYKVRDRSIVVGASHVPDVEGKKDGEPLPRMIMTTFGYQRINGGPLEVHREVKDFLINPTGQPGERVAMIQTTVPELLGEKTSAWTPPLVELGNTGILSVTRGAKYEQFVRMIAPVMLGNIPEDEFLRTVEGEFVPGNVVALRDVVSFRTIEG